MSTIWFCSDLHFGHNKPFLYEPRGFSNIYEHDETIIKNWNKLVTYDDDVYLLGDVMLNDDVHGLKCLKSLHGQIHLILGNHDSNNRIELYDTCFNIVEICAGKFLKVGKQRFYLSHYPTLTSNYDENKPLKSRVINLCGHSHTKDKFADFDKGVIYHVELDAHDNKPVSIDTILKDIQGKYN
jgi:calcineurin-like phosphoesterase family protein